MARIHVPVHVLYCTCSFLPVLQGGVRPRSASVVRSAGGRMWDQEPVEPLVHHVVVDMEDGGVFSDSALDSTDL